MALRLDYFIGETFTNLRRNMFMTFTAISIVSVSLFLLGAVIVFGDIMGRLVGAWEDRVEVNIFLRDEITPSQAKELEQMLQKMPEVDERSIDYVSKDEAYEEFKDTYKSSPQVYQQIESDVLPASYRFKLHDPNKVDVVRTRIEGRPGVDEVLFGGEVVKKLLRFTGLVRAVGVGLTLMFLGAATLLIANTIRLAIYARRREIGIMKLVGATNWFIRVPFIFEGMAEGAIGATVATGAIFAFKELLLDRAQTVIPFLPLTVTGGDVLRVLVVLLTVGTVIGALGSALALRRFLEV